jgi:hypothetical protein
MARSISVLLLGRIPSTVPGKGVNAPVAFIAKPEIVDEAEFAVYTKRPSGVTSYQQVAAPNVGTLVLMGVITPLASTE